MARGVNKVILVGNVGGDPETRYMPNGNAVTNITLATSESWKDKQTGQQQERTEWHRVVFFGRPGLRQLRRRHSVLSDALAARPVRATGRPSKTPCRPRAAGGLRFQATPRCKGTSSRPPMADRASRMALSLRQVSRYSWAGSESPTRPQPANR